jgi:hypothetical protein
VYANFIKCVSITLRTPVVMRKGEWEIREGRGEEEKEEGKRQKKEEKWGGRGGEAEGEGEWVTKSSA